MTSGPQGPRIYNLFPLLLGPVSAWEERLGDIAAMGFNWIFLNPFHYPGASGSLYSVKDYYRLHPLFQGGSKKHPHAVLEHFTRAAADAGLEVMMDLVVNHTAKDSGLVSDHPGWYLRDESGAVRSPFAVDPNDPSHVTVWEDLAELDYRERPERAEMIAYWSRLLTHYTGLGFRGFRCDAAYKIPGVVWQELIRGAREVDREVRFFAETLGAQLREVDQLSSAGFDYFFNSAKWWDFRSDWLLDQYEHFRRVAPSIAFPESHDTERLAAQNGGSERASRFWYLFAAFFSGGVMMPIGYELGFRRPLHVVSTRPEDWEEPEFDISEFIRAVNAMKADTPVLNAEGPQWRFTSADEPVVGLLRRLDEGSQRAAALINPDAGQGRDFSRAALADAMQSERAKLREITPLGPGEGLGDRETLRLEPQGIRIFLID